MQTRTRTAPRRVRMLHVLLSDAERAMLRETALRQQRTVSDVVRDALAQYRAEAIAR